MASSRFTSLTWVAVMKLTQAVLLLVLLVVMVFAVTFASMYVRDTPATKKSEETPQGPGLQLTFASKEVPEGRNLSQLIATEFDGRGQHDFWFRNDNDQAVLLGLREKNCQCAVVRVFVAPSAWRKPLEEAEVRRQSLKDEVELAGSLVGKLADDIGKAEVERTHKQLLARADLRSMATLDSPSGEGVEIPPRALGFVRLEWEWDRRRVKPGPQAGVRLWAKLWMQDARTGPLVQLSATVLYVEPVLVDKSEFSLGVLNPDESKTSVVYCWSPTRANFRLEAKLAERRVAPLIRCEVEKLNEAEHDKLRDFIAQRYFAEHHRDRSWAKLNEADRQRWRSNIGPIRASYRVTLRMRERLDARTRFDEGPFEYRVDLVPFDGEEKLKPLPVSLRGTVHGDVLVDSAESSIHLEPFPTNQGTTREVTLSSQQAELDLKVDHHPPFMKVGLTKEKTSSGLRWKLHLEIRRNQVVGTFPQAGNEAYKDTAIYLKISGEGNRLLRIPVSGTATQ
jgi:hypothetical protein